jgi:adenosylcobinamide-GDP ribazoletransferase
VTDRPDPMIAEAPPISRWPSGFLTRLPLRVNGPPRHRARRGRGLGLAGGGRGGGRHCGGGRRAGALAGAATGVAAGLALGAGIVVTGALHEDGLADCADGFWGGYTPERRLEIMADSRIGSYGVRARHQHIIDLLGRLHLVTAATAATSRVRRSSAAS